MTGASATSHAFLSLSVSVSSVVGGARAATFEEACCFWTHVRIEEFDRASQGIFTLLPVEVAVNPGGSGIPADFGFAIGGEFRSMTH